LCASRRSNGGADGIRINTVHPNAVFDTGLWDRGRWLAQRAKQYAMTVEEYKTNKRAQDPR